jgi:hypothetical protein
VIPFIASMRRVSAATRGFVDGSTGINVPRGPFTGGIAPGPRGPMTLGSAGILPPSFGTSVTPGALVGTVFCAA